MNAFLIISVVLVDVLLLTIGIFGIIIYKAYKELEDKQNRRKFWYHPHTIAKYNK